MIIKSKNFILRKPRTSDLKSYYLNKMDDKAIDAGFIGYKLPYKLKNAKKHLEEAILNNNKKSFVNFMIVVDNKVVGEVMFSEIIPKLSAKIGYWIGKDYRGKGITTKAVILACKFIEKEYEIKRIFGNVRTKNKSSVRVLEKAGFKLEGVQKKHSLKNGKYFNDFLYAKVK